MTYPTAEQANARARILAAHAEEMFGLLDSLFMAESDQKSWSIIHDIFDCVEAIRDEINTANLEKTTAELCSVGTL